MVFVRLLFQRFDSDVEFLAEFAWQIGESEVIYGYIRLQKGNAFIGGVRFVIRKGRA